MYEKILWLWKESILTDLMLCAPSPRIKKTCFAQNWLTNIGVPSTVYFNSMVTSWPLIYEKVCIMSLHEFFFIPETGQKAKQASGPSPYGVTWFWKAPKHFSHVSQVPYFWFQSQNLLAIAVSGLHWSNSFFLGVFNYDKTLKPVRYL
jgi:hypothetical protein